MVIRLGVFGLGLRRDVRLVVVCRRLVLLRLSLCLRCLLGRGGLLDSGLLCRGLLRGGRGLRRRGRGLAGGEVAGLLLLLHLPERHGKSADQRTERADKTADGRGDDSDELPV